MGQLSKEVAKFPRKDVPLGGLGHRAKSKAKYGGYGALTYVCYEYVLVIIDRFTKYTQAYSTRNKSTTAAVEKIYNDFIPRFGFPSRIHHDL